LERREFPQLVWQALRGRHVGLADQHRHDRFRIPQRLGQLPAHGVIGHVNPATTISVAGTEPIVTDDGQHDVGLGQILSDPLGPLVSRTNPGNVHEDVVVPGLQKGVIDVPGRLLRIVPAVAQEDLQLWHQLSPLTGLVSPHLFGMSTTSPPRRLAAGSRTGPIVAGTADMT